MNSVVFDETTVLKKYQNHINNIYLVTAETCFWDPYIGKGKCMDCSCDTKLCALPENCFTNIESNQSPLLSRSRFDHTVANKMSRFEFKRHSKNCGKHKQKMKSILYTSASYKNFWDQQVESYDTWDSWDTLYSNENLYARKNVEPPIVESAPVKLPPVEPPPVEPPSVEPPPVEPAPVNPPPVEPPPVEPPLVEPSPVGPKVQKLFFRKPYDVKRKPFRHLVHHRTEPSPLQRMMFRAPKELKEEIFKNISKISSLENITDVDQRRLQDLIAYFMYLNKHGMIYD